MTHEVLLSKDEMSIALKKAALIGVGSLQGKALQGTVYKTIAQAQLDKIRAGGRGLKEGYGERYNPESH